MYHKQYDFSIHDVVHDFRLVHHACVRACASGLMASIWFNRTPKPIRGRVGAGAGFSPKPGFNETPGSVHPGPD
jgi:hypothetical protein